MKPQASKHVGVLASMLFCSATGGAVAFDGLNT